MKKWKKVGKILGIILIGMILVYIGIYVVARLMPKLPINSANSFYLYDKNDELFTAGNQKEWVSLDEISPYVIDATLSIEDKHFYQHQGFDFLRIIKALYINFTSGQTKQGASTITQQYAKNLFLDFDKTWERKIEEAWLTIRLEAHYSKDKILEGYLKNKSNDKIEIRKRNILKHLYIDGMKQSEFINKFCTIIEAGFDKIFGEGTSKKIFKGKKNFKLCVQAFKDMIKARQYQENEVNNEINTLQNEIQTISYDYSIERIK